MKKFSSFTLIELLIVIVIIGILATALVPRITSMQAKARDTKRLADLRQIQSALELYASEHQGLYPISSPPYRGYCGGRGGFGTSGENGYVPNLAPEYITELPIDPKPTNMPDECYVYRSDGKDYIIMALRTVENSTIPPGLQRNYIDQDLNIKTYALYTSGARAR